MKHRFKRLIEVQALVVCMLALFACEKKEGEIIMPTGKKTDVLLQLSAPGSYSKTKGLTAEQENDILNVYVLAFDKSGNLVQLRHGQSISGIGATRTFSVSLTPSESAQESHKQNLVVIANAEDILKKTIGSGVNSDLTFESVTGQKDYATVMGAIVENFTDKLYSSGGRER